MSNKLKKEEFLEVDAEVKEIPAEEKVEEPEKKKIGLKDRLRNFGEKHPKITKIGKYAAAAGAGALVVIGGKSVLGLFGLSAEDEIGFDDDGSSLTADTTTSAPAEPAAKDETE